MHDPGVNRRKLTLRMLLLSIFLDWKVKKNQNMIKEPSLGTSLGLLLSLLILSIWTTPIGVFPDYFSLSNVLASSCCLYKKRLSSLKFALNLASIRSVFGHLSVLVCCCEANQSSKIIRIFSQFLKTSAHSKG